MHNTQTQTYSKTVLGLQKPNRNSAEAPQIKRRYVVLYEGKRKYAHHKLRTRTKCKPPITQTFPAQIVRLRGGFVFLHQTVNDLARFVQLAEVILEHVLLLELVEKGTAFAQLIVLVEDALKQLQQKGHVATIDTSQIAQSRS